MLLNRLTGLLAGVGLAASLALAAPAPAAAATTITVTATGTITAGVDNDGSLTGTPGSDLSGIAASIVHVFSLTPGASIDDTTPGEIFAFFEAVTTTVTVGAGSPVTFSTTNGSGFYNLIALTSLDASSIIFDGTTELVTQILVVDPALTVSSLLEDYDYTAMPATGDWSFSAVAFNAEFDQLSWAFVATPDRVTVKVAVPAPAALGLFLVGLAGLAAARRRV